MKSTAFTMAVAAGILASASVRAESSASVSTVVIPCPENSLLWKTVVSPTKDFFFDWPTGAVKAVVRVDGAVRATVDGPLAKKATLSFDLPAAGADERVVDVEVSYLDSGDGEISTSNVRLGLVAGTSAGEAVAVPVRSAADAKAWGRIYARSAVLPMLDSTTNLVVDGSARAGYSAPGWYYWTPVDGSEHLLSLVAEDTVYSARIRGIAGMYLFLR